MTLRSPAQIIIRAPHHVPESAIAAFLQKRRAWVLRQVGRCEEALSLRSDISRTCSWPFLGETRQHPGTPPCSIERWYRREATVYLKERTQALAHAMLLPAPRIRINSARRRWGSCSANNVISFPWRLMMLPPDVIDYIVVHELAHIKEKNHGPGFWRSVQATIPTYAAHRQWLRNNQHLFSELTHEQTQT
jgi:predicted metal-dependent hydrolase